MLLQVVVALMPVFAIQLWYDRSQDRKKIPMVIGVFCLLAMVVGFFGSDKQTFTFDFRLIPLFLGSLYGGPYTPAILTLSYAVMQILRWEGQWTLLEIGGMLLIMLPLLIYIRSIYQAAAWWRKLRHVMLLTAVMVVIQASAFGFFQQAFPASEEHIYVKLLIHFILCFIMTGTAFYMFETFNERQQLREELERISNKYRIEVQKLQQFIDKTPLGVLFTDQSGRITHMNDIAAKTMLFQLENGEGDRTDRASESAANTALRDRDLNLLAEGANQSVLNKQLTQALGGQAATAEIIQHQDKMYMQTSISVRDIENNEVVGAAIISHDVTEINRLRDELGRMERLSLVGQMAASITHEIRNPMAVIRGFVQLMKERSPSGQQDYFRIVIEELDRANSIINDFLSLAQNRMSEKEYCSLHDILNEILPLLWADANMRGLTIELDLAQEMPELLLNEKEIKQLILNLARNAMEATDYNGVLKLSTSVEEYFVELHVIDYGCGIPQEQIDRLFEPFFTTKSKGTGLGLPLCLSIVERHGGQIRVESEEGAGTTFISTFSRRLEK